MAIGSISEDKILAFLAGEEGCEVAEYKAELRKVQQQLGGRLTVFYAPNRKVNAQLLESCVSLRIGFVLFHGGLKIDWQGAEIYRQVALTTFDVKGGQTAVERAVLDFADVFMTDRSGDPELINDVAAMGVGVYVVGEEVPRRPVDGTKAPRSGFKHRTELFDFLDSRFGGSRKDCSEVIFS